MILRFGKHAFTFPRPPLVMGSLRVDAQDALSLFGRAQQMVSDGADVIAVRVQPRELRVSSSHAGEDEHILCRFIRLWNDAAQTVPLAVDVSCTKQARAVLEAGASSIIINISDPDASCASYALLCRDYGAGLVVNFRIMSGINSTTHRTQEDLLNTIENVFTRALGDVAASGLAKESVVLGVRLDGSSERANAESLHVCGRVSRYHAFERPLLLTDFSGEAERTSNEPAQHRALELQTARVVARIVHGMLAGVQLFQTDDVRSARATVATIGAVLF